MATIKNKSNVLGNMMAQINNAIPNQPLQGQFTSPGTYGPSSGISIDDDSIPANMLNTAPVFDMNYKSAKKQCYKKAKEQLKVIVSEVVPTILQNSGLIVDKINQDAEQLGNLYYEYEKSDKVVQALMETISKGETQARLFEVYTKMTKELRELSNIITNTQNQMRKYYIDTYMDLQQKDDADETLGIPGKQQPALESSQQNTTTAIEGNVMVGTENIIKKISEKKRQAMLAEYEEVK